MITVKITIDELLACSACADGVAKFAESGMDGVAFEWTHTAQIGVIMSGMDYRWAQEIGLLPWFDLRGAILRVAEMRWADLTEANMRGADLRGANLYGANLTGVIQ